MIGNVVHGRYELTVDLGETPIFHAFAARDQLQGRDVCVRIVKGPFDQEPEFVDKLGQVIRQVAHQNNPGLERVYGLEPGNPTILVSELARGTSLLERLKKLGSLSVPVAVQMAIGVCEAVQSLHAAGVVHGDIGSHNVTVGAEGELKVQMYAVWQAFASSASAGGTMLRLMAPYLAPEIGKGGYPTPSSDVYAIGVLMYEMLSGRYPFHADSPVAMAMKHATDATPNVRMMNPSVPTVLAEIVKKAMAKEPSERYRDAGDMASDLRVLQDALRFGRTLSWPIREESRPAPPQPIAPKMPAVKEVKQRAMREDSDDPYEEEPSPDVPGWIKGLIILFAGMLAALVFAWVLFNMNQPRQVTVPDVRRLSITEAMARLEAIGLKLRVSRRQPSEQIPKDQVIDTAPDPGELVKEGSSVSVTISVGSKFVEVPDVIGMSVDQAKTLLASVDLKVDDAVERVPSDKVKEGMIVTQFPEAKRKVQRLSSIRVQVSSGKDSKANDPASRIKYQYTLRIPLEGLETAIRLRVDMTDAKGTKTVHEAEHEPGELVEIIAEGFGKTAKFKVYYDDELVATKDVQADESEAIE